MFNLLRIEAINFGQSISDTNQLSVVRGGGLLMRESIIDLAEVLKAHLPRNGEVDFHTVSTGGSIGVFLYRREALERSVFVQALEHGLSNREFSDQTPVWLKDALEEFRTKEAGKVCHLLSFAVSVQEVKGGSAPEAVAYTDFRNAERRALSEIRIKQMRQPNVVVSGPAATEVCTWDGLRPAARGRAVRGEPLSESVWTRFEIGRDSKRDGPLFRFFSRELNKVPEDGGGDNPVRKAREILKRLTGDAQASSPGFPQDLEELCGAVDNARHPTKLAVLYADGNKFGRIVGDRLGSVKEYEEWDRKLQQSRARFLASLLNWLDEKRHPTEPMPLEILLWGGDEIMIALPADLALEAVSRFYEFTADLEWKEQKLTHALGLVICNFKTRIHRIKTLAISLAERVKAELGDEPEQQKNAWQYAVLESVDTPTDLKAFFSERYAEAASAMKPLLGNKSSFGDLMELVRGLQFAVPRSQLYGLAHKLSREPGDRDAVHRFKKVTGISLKKLSDDMADVLPQIPLPEELQAAELASRVLHWTELLDYWPSPSEGALHNTPPEIAQEARHG